MLLPALLAAGVTYAADIKPVLDELCVSCHRTTFDLSVFPFEGSRWPTQEETVRQLAARMRRTDWRRMPPPRVAAEPLPEETIALFDRWLADGLPRE